MNQVIKNLQMVVRAAEAQLEAANAAKEVATKKYRAQLDAYNRCEVDDIEAIRNEYMQACTDHATAGKALVRAKSNLTIAELSL